LATPNFTGGAASESATPDPFGPRNCGQFSTIKNQIAHIAGLYRDFP
jgi:hypothetical protein